MQHRSIDKPRGSFLALTAVLSLLAACSGGGGGGTSEDSGGDTLAIQGLTAAPELESALVTWKTNAPTSGLVEWGQGNAFDQVVTISELSSEHNVELSGLDPAETYQYRVLATRADGKQSWSNAKSFTTLPPGAFQSDDFDRNNLKLATWTLVDPLGDALVRMTGTGSSNPSVELGVPGGLSHDAWTTNQAARLVQACADEDFVLETKLVNGFSQGGTGSGVIVEQDAANWLRFDFAFNNNKLGFYAASFVGGSVHQQTSGTVSNGAWPDGAALWLRVARSGSLYIGTWSMNGSQWNPGFSFQTPIVPVRVGLQAINSGSPSSPHTLRADTFFDVLEAQPTDDVGTPADGSAPYLYRASSSAQDSSSVRLAWNADEPVTATVRWGLTTSYEGGSKAIGTPAYESVWVASDLMAETTYHFQVTARDALGHETSSPDLVATTLAEGENAVPSLTLWRGQPEGSAWRVEFGAQGNAQPQFNLLGNVRDGDEDRVALTVTLYYQLNGGAWKALALGDDRHFSYNPWRLVSEGDFNVELYVDQLDDVPPSGNVHHNVVQLLALDDEGHETQLTVNVDYRSGVTWDPATQISWSDVLAQHGEVVDSAAQVVDGEWYVENDAVLGPVLRQRSWALGYDRLVALGEGHGPDAWTDYEVETTATPLTLDPEGFTTGTSSYAFGFGMRWTGHTPGGTFNQPNHDIYPLGGLYIYRWYPTYEVWQLWVNKDRQVINLPGGNPVYLGTTYRFRLRCESLVGGGTRYAMRMWVDGTAEPSDWNYDYQTAVDQDPQSGSFLFIAHHVDVRFGDVTVTPLNGGN